MFGYFYWRYLILRILINTGAGIGFFPDGAELLPETMLNRIDEILWHLSHGDINNPYVLFEMCMFESTVISPRN